MKTGLPLNIVPLAYGVRTMTQPQTCQEQQDELRGSEPMTVEERDQEILNDYWQTKVKNLERENALLHARVEELERPIHPGDPVILTSMADTLRVGPQFVPRSEYESLKADAEAYNRLADMLDEVHAIGGNTGNQEELRESLQSLKADAEKYRKACVELDTSPVGMWEQLKADADEMRRLRDHPKLAPTDKDEMYLFRMTMNILELQNEKHSTIIECVKSIKADVAKWREIRERCGRLDPHGPDDIMRWIAEGEQAQAFLSNSEADAELGALVRKMPCGSGLFHENITTEDWTYSDGPAYSVRSHGKTPEETLRAALREPKCSTA